MELRRFIGETVPPPSRIIRRVRRTTRRIIGRQKTTGRLFIAWNTIERTGWLATHMP